MAQNDLTRYGEINALLGRGTEYRGKLTFEGRVRIDGRFEGEIFSDDLLILGEGAEVRADIDVGTLIVRGGELWGEVRARQLVEIHAPGKVHGDIRTPQIFIDKGVVFDGRCVMEDESPSEVLSTDDVSHPAAPAFSRAAAGTAPEAAPPEEGAEPDATQDAEEDAGSEAPEAPEGENPPGEAGEGTGAR